MSLLPILLARIYVISYNLGNRLGAQATGAQQLPCFDLISVTLQLLDFFLEVRLVLFFLIHIFSVIDLCHTLSSSMSQNLPTV